MRQLTFLTALLLSFSMAFGQITLEQTYDHSGTYTSLAISGDKFFIMDVGASQCRIYNIDHTLWKTIDLAVPADHYLYDVRYVSENLFTDDNSLCLFYVYYHYDEVGQYYTYTARIMKENGTELLTIPGCSYNYVVTLTDGTTKMITYSYDYSVFPYTIQTRVYDLPGHLTSFAVSENAGVMNMMNAFPNPTNSYTTIPYQMTGSETKGEIFISDAEGRVVRTIPVSCQSTEVTIETSQFQRGIYFYQLQTANQRSQARKLVIN
jgi:hypothetical protein